VSGKSSKSKRKKHHSLALSLMLVVDNQTMRAVLAMPNTQQWWREYMNALTHVSADPINKFYRAVLHLSGKAPTARDITRLLHTIGKLRKGDPNEREVVRNNGSARLPVVW
jgi:hypothetical protein